MFLSSEGQGSGLGRCLAESIVRVAAERGNGIRHMSITILALDRNSRCRREGSLAAFRPDTLSAELQLVPGRNCQRLRRGQVEIPVYRYIRPTGNERTPLHGPGAESALICTWSDGHSPNWRTYARENAAALPNPTCRATTFIRAPLESLRRAMVKRQPVR